MKYDIIFGPVPSRRLGVSLGVDLMPYKTCSMDCVYCEIGKTKELTIDRNEYIDYRQVIKELKDYLTRNPELDYITFSGAGEPTLYNKISQVITFLKSNYPEYKLALLTNGSLFDNPEIRNDCLGVDLIIPSLDAVSERVFQKINRPHPGLKIENIINGLIKLREEFMKEIWLEIFIIPGLNDTLEELARLKEKALLINPDKIQLNSLDRPGTEKWIQRASFHKLKAIADFFLPLKTGVITAYQSRKEIDSYDMEVESNIISTIKRRPCTEDELMRLTGLKINELNKYLSTLIADRRIDFEEESRGRFIKPA